jgi:AMP deaminase
MNQFDLRPHCGEAGSLSHLTTAYRLARGVNHGVNLRNSRSLQYLYYLDQVGIAVSPVSNNFLFLKFADSPFRKFFNRGLNVTLSTDDPMFFHLSDDPLLEEYAISRQVWDLTTVDMCEIARNSVLQSGFPHEWKVQQLGATYQHPNLTKATNSALTNVPPSRAKFRHDNLVQERQVVESIARRGDDNPEENKDSVV